MPWIDPTTRSTGDLITAAIWNADLVDNLIYLHHGLPMARVYNGANISIANATLTALTFNSERYDTDAIHDTASNTSRLTCKTAGKYLIGGNAAWGSTGTDERRLQIRLNGATLIASWVGNSGANMNMYVATVYDLAVNDYVELMVYQATGGAINVTAAGNYSPEFWMHRIG